MPLKIGSFIVFAMLNGGGGGGGVGKGVCGGGGGGVDLLNNIGEVLLWSEEFGNGLSGKNDK